MFDPVRLYRVYHRLWRWRVPGLPSALYRLNRIFTACDLPPSVIVGTDTELAHWGWGVAVSPNSVIGDGCRIYPGARILADPSALQRPRVVIKARVQIGVGAVVLAARELEIGDEAQIGAGALVVDSVRAGTTIVRCHDIALRDRCRNPRRHRKPLANPVRVHAICRWLHLRKLPLLPGLFYRLNYLLNRCVIAPTSAIAPTASIGRWVALSFANVGPHAELEDGVIIARNVRHRKAAQAGHIEVAADAKIGARAIIVGADGMRIGEGARIESGAVAHKSIPPGCTVAGVPARIVARPNKPEWQ